MKVFILIGLALAAFSVSAEMLSGRVVGITDGDTLTLARPFIIGPHGRLGFLEGGALEEKIYRRTNRPGIGRSRGWNDGSGRVSQTQRF